jgi:long-chain acyl-CoA synthetase
MLNLAVLLEDSAREFPDRAAVVLGENGLTYAQVDAAANQVANALVARGVGPGDRVALSCPNLPYFPVVYYGILKAGAAVVPLNILLNEREIAYHLQDSGATGYFCFEGTADLPVGKAGFAAFEATAGCELFVLLSVDPADTSPIVQVDTLAEFVHGQPTSFDTVPTSETDTAVVLYTSGTTGRPKGAELTHSNLVQNALLSSRLFGLVPDDVLLLTLPLFHSFGQSVQMNAGFASRAKVVLLPKFDPAAALSLMERERVTVFAGVPTMYWALLSCPDTDGVDLDRIAGTLRLAISGGAPLSFEIAEFFHAIDILLVEGYGLTECTTAASTNTHEAYRFGTVGRALPGTEVKLAEDGELLVRSETVFQGYLKDPEATAEVLGADGWLRTGDIAEIDEDGFIKITDRKKDIIVTAGGKNVSPQNLENDLKTSKYISQAMVVGDRQPYIAALITLDPESLPAWAAERGLPIEMERLADEGQVQELIQGVVDAVNADRSRYEQIKRFTILPRDFTMDDDELTPTLKLKRRVVTKHFGNELQELYAGETLNQAAGV